MEHVAKEENAGFSGRDFRHRGKFRREISSILQLKTVLATTAPSSRDDDGHRGDYRRKTCEKPS